MRLAASDFAGMCGITRDFPARTRCGAVVWSVQRGGEGMLNWHTGFIGRAGKFVT